MKEQGESLIREKLGEYVRRLKEEFSQGLILPTKNSSSNTSNTKTVSSLINTNTTTTSKPVSNTQSSI